MGKIDDHRAMLRQFDDWMPYLTEHSGLPGPRGNLELVAACGEEADAARAEQLVATGDEFATVCGLVGLGRLLGEGDDLHVDVFHAYASDPRWRVREGVAMAVQRACDNDPGRGFRLAERWAADPDALVRRAAVAAVCEPRLLRDKAFALRGLRVVDRATQSVRRSPAGERRDPALRTLRQALGYGWSVVIAAAPTEGLLEFRLIESDGDRDVAWIVRENKKKARFGRAIAAAEVTQNH